METERLLIIGPSWVGDMVMAQSLFIILKQQNPQRDIDVLAPAWSLPLLKRMPEVNQGIIGDFAHGEVGLGKRWRLARELKKHNYQQAILLPNSLKSALLPMFAGIPRRTGWRGEFRFGLLNDLRYLDNNALPFMVQRFAALAYQSSAPAPAMKSIPAPKLIIDEQQVEQALTDLAIDYFGDKKILTLCPGAEFGPSKQWSAESYARVAKQHIHHDGEVWLFGSANDVAICEQIKSRLTEDEQASVRVLAGETSLEQAIDLMSLSSAVVSNDSGLMHIAAALSKPLVAIYGSTSPKFTPPLLDEDKHFLMQKTVPCGPCFERECPNNSEKFMRCMKKIEPQEVSYAISQLLEQRVE